MSNLLINIKPRLHKRFFARAGDAIFSNFVASPTRDDNHTWSHLRTGEATGEKVARKKSCKIAEIVAHVASLQLFPRAGDATKEHLVNEISIRSLW